jgi:hypothetical protein
MKAETASVVALSGRKVVHGNRCVRVLRAVYLLGRRWLGNPVEDNVCQKSAYRRSNREICKGVHPVEKRGHPAEKRGHMHRGM